MKKIKEILLNEEKRTLIILGISLISIILSGFNIFKNIPFDLAFIAIILCGIPIIFKAIKGLITKFDITSDVLVAIALIAAVLIGEYFAAAEVAFIMQLGELLEDFTVRKSRKNIESLFDKSPLTATLKTSTIEKIINVSEIKKDDILLIRPGDKIPVDGIIIKGYTSIDQSIITGESVPLNKIVGDTVYQGTINQEGSVEIVALTINEESSLKKMIKLVNEAEAKKAKIEKIADKWAKILVPTSLLIALLIYLITKDITRAVTAIIVFCPCALVLATPTAIVAAIGVATKKGILIKSGLALEEMAKINVFAFDKTGTLTKGTLQIQEIVMLDNKYSEREFIALVASAENNSTHPISKTIVKYAKDNNIEFYDSTSFEMRPGMGIIANVESKKIVIGDKLIANELKSGYYINEIITNLLNKGLTTIPVLIDDVIIGIIAVADIVKDDVFDVIAELKKQGIEKAIMLTGDNLLVANSVADKCGIDSVYASMLPIEKNSKILELKDMKNNVAMLGDGVNDALSLASSNVGIVMGAIGSDVAIEAADIALMGDDIKMLPYLLKLSKKTRKTIILNIIFSMSLNFIALILAGLGTLNPITAAIVHNVGSVLVIINSAFLLKYRGK